MSWLLISPQLFSTVKNVRKFTSLLDLNLVLTLEESFLLMEDFTDSKPLQPAFMNISLHVFEKWALFHVVETLIFG